MFGNEGGIDDISEFGDIVAMMFPKQLQVAASFTFSFVVYEIFTTVFDVAASQGLNFNAQGIVMAQIKKEIKELSKKVDLLLHADMRAGKSMLRKAVQYLSSKETYPTAIQEFKNILILVERAFTTVQGFEHQVFCKQTEIFARFMIDTYDEENKSFVPLPKISIAKKEIIATNIWHDVQELHHEFSQVQRPRKRDFLKRMFNADKPIKQQNQKLYDTILKFSTPIMLYYVKELQEMEEFEMVQYVPEGIDDAAIMTLDENLVIKIWKEERTDNEFDLKWQPYVIDVRIGANMCLYGNSLAAQMTLPPSSNLLANSLIHQSSPSTNMIQRIYKVLVDIFALTPAPEELTDSSSFNIGHEMINSNAFHDIEKQIEAMCQRVDNILRTVLETVQGVVKQAIIELEDSKQYPMAYKSFQMASIKLKDVLPKLKTLEDQILVHRLATFTDYMHLSFHERKKTFVPFRSLSNSVKETFSVDMFNRLSGIMDLFDGLKLAPRNVLLEKGKEEDLKRHDLLLDVIKFNFPIIWHYKLKDLKTDDIMRFIPEDIENCAEIILDNNVSINIWKYEYLQDTPDGQRRPSIVPKKEYQFQWCPKFVLDTANNSPFMCISNKTCSSNWVDVLKKSKQGKMIWERISIESINSYLCELSEIKFW